MIKRRQELRGKICVLALFVSIGGVFPNPLKADTGAEVAGSHPTKPMLSLIDVAPQLYKTAKRSWTFYGDANTTQGSFSQRSHLLGNISGNRDTLIEHGVYLDVGVTQFLQGNLSGGERESPDPRYNGSTDLWLWLDTGKAGLWSGGAVFVHGEGQWDRNRGINQDVGSTLPANQDATMPSPDPDASRWALSEWYLLQALPGNLLEGSDMPLSEIALRLGYSEHSAFSRAFRAWTGGAPQTYRRHCA